MSLILTIFFGFLGWLALKAAWRSAKIGGSAVDSLFDKIESKIKR